MRVLIVGSKGTVGSVLRKGLAHQHDVVEFDLPEHDALNLDDLVKTMHGADVVIHVGHSASQEHRENWRSGKIDPANVQMEMNIFEAVAQSGVRRLILASSVHADNFNEYEGNDLLTVPGSYVATSPYGAHKLITEEIGRFYSRHHGFDFIAIRFGGVTPDNSVKTILKEPAVWLSHRDLVQAVGASLQAEHVPDNYCVFYAVSNNKGRIHDVSNPFGWAPEDNSADKLGE